jgi:hypothetical protein
MNAIQLALRTAAHARDYRAIEDLIDAGATSADLLYSVIHDMARTGNTLLFEILLCAAPVDYDFSLARAIERKVRSGATNVNDGELLALQIRAVLWRKLHIDHLLDEASRHLEVAFESSTAIVKLSGFELSQRSLGLKERIVAGELTFDEAVQIVIDNARALQDT